MAKQQVITLDVREMPPRERHSKIFELFEALPANGTLQLVNDHDPKPLYYQFQAEHPARCDGSLNRKALRHGLSTSPR